MALNSFPRLVLLVCLSVLAVHWSLAQTVAPSNDTAAANNTVQFVLDTTVSMMEIHPNIEPLTNDAGLTGTLNQLENINWNGPLILTNSKTVLTLSPGNIAYISCEPGDYTGSIDASRTITLAVNNKPYAIVLYSVYADSCSFQPTNDFSYTSMYTMVNANSSATVVAGLNKNNPAYPVSTIHVDPTSVNGTNGGGGGNILGKSPTTAVAMIILYSITGIITALFLIIIIVGAIRAHRHPERYGPRQIQGRPRQSRAKGIARAMLETIPIVKFDDKDDDKPATQARDIEMAPTAAPNPDTPTREEGARDGTDVVTTVAAAGSAQSKQGTNPAKGEANDADNGLACSVCTDDFVKGQDIRVLPCKHKFHPECIDPWLLNVSGTCPLCRVDLHPANSPTSSEFGPNEDDTEAPPPIDTATTAETRATEATHRNRRSRIMHTLNIGHMRQATPQERIEALRTLRSENQATTATSPENGGLVVGESTRSRLGARLSRAFGSRPASGAPSSRPVSEVPPSVVETPEPAPAPATATETETEGRRQGSLAG